MSDPKLWFRFYPDNDHPGAVEKIVVNYSAGVSPHNTWLQLVHASPDIVPNSHSIEIGSELPSTWSPPKGHDGVGRIANATEPVLNQSIAINTGSPTNDTFKCILVATTAGGTKLVADTFSLHLSFNNGVPQIDIPGRADFDFSLDENIPGRSPAISDATIVQPAGFVEGSAIGGPDGKFLALRTDAAPFVQILDLETQRLLTLNDTGFKESPLVAANPTSVFTYEPATRSLRTWSLATLEEQAQRTIEHDLLSISAAADNSNAPLMGSTWEYVAAFDALTLETVPLVTSEANQGTHRDIVEKQLAPADKPDESRDKRSYVHTTNTLTYSGDGTVAHLRRSGIVTIGDKPPQPDARMTVRSTSIVPVPGGRTRYAPSPSEGTEAGYSGLTSASGYNLITFYVTGETETYPIAQPVLPGSRERLSAFRAFSTIDPYGSSFVNVAWKLPSFPATPPTLLVYNGRNTEKPSAVVHGITEIGELSLATIDRRNARSPGQRIWFLPGRGKLVVLPDSGKVFIRNFDPKDLLSDEEAGGIVVTSAPPAIAVRAQDYTYQLTTLEKSGINYTLKDSPGEASITPGGLLTWATPRGFPNDVAEFTVELSRPGSPVPADYKFKVSVVGPPPARLFVVKRGSPGTEPTALVPTAEVILPHPSYARSIGGQSALVALAKNQRALSVVDLSRARVGATVELPAVAKFLTSNQQLAFVYYPQTRTIESRRLGNLQEVVSAKLPQSGELVDLGVAQNSDSSPLVAIVDDGSKVTALLYSPRTLRPERIASIPLGTRPNVRWENARLTLSPSGHIAAIGKFVFSPNAPGKPAIENTNLQVEPHVAAPTGAKFYGTRRLYDLASSQRRDLPANSLLPGDGGKVTFTDQHNNRQFTSFPGGSLGFFDAENDSEIAYLAGCVEFVRNRGKLDRFYLGKSKLLVTVDGTGQIVYVRKLEM